MTVHVTDVKFNNSILLLQNNLLVMEFHCIVLILRTLTDTYSTTGVLVVVLQQHQVCSTVGVGVADSRMWECTFSRPTSRTTGWASKSTSRPLLSCSLMSFMFLLLHGFRNTPSVDGPLFLSNTSSSW